ncbi:50S ribosomal protein L35 [bacterium]|nr:50S ribosomal protein L35 [candidate division CSSED10-310 bacterium]
MPKIKTNRSAAKRFKRTANGHFKRSKAFAGHILTKKTRKRKRNFRKIAVVNEVDEGRLVRLLPYL